MKTFFKRLLIAWSTGWLGLSLIAQNSLPVAPTGINGQSGVTAGKFHSLALGEESVLWAWGANDKGQLGINSTVSTSLVPVQISGGGVWSLVSAGDEHTLAIRKDGSLWAWGNNDEGQLGDGTFAIKRAPVRVGTEIGWVAISAGTKFSLALKSDGRLFAWGLNTDGQLGTLSLAAPKHFSSPRLVQYSNGTIPLFSGISAGANFSLALGPKTTNGGASLFAWGANAVNQLGLGEPTQKDANGNTLDADTVQPGRQLPLNVFSPLRVGSDSTWTVISAGELHSLAVKQSGTVYSWGLDILGSLGRTGDVSYPGLVSGVSNVSMVSAGGNHSLALASGKVYGWGSNADGQLGFPLFNEYGTFLSNNLSRATPALLNANSGWTIVAGGSGHSLIFGIGKTVGLGRNVFGQLGNGTSVSPNGFALSSTKFGLSDLTVTGITVLNATPSALLPGDILNLRITFKNLGTASLDSGFAFFQARLSSDGVFDLSDPLLTPIVSPLVVNSRLSGGGEVVQDFSFTIPGSLTSDIYNVVVRIDDNSTVVESDETNNDFLGVQEFRFLPNLTILPQPYSGTWQLSDGVQTTTPLSRQILGEELSVALNTLNSGSGPFGSRVSVLPGAAGQFLVTFQNFGDFPLLSGNFANLIPSKGQVRVVTEGSPTSSEVQEIFLSDNPITILSPTTVARGGLFSATVVLSNSGATPFISSQIPSPVRVRLIMTIDSTIGNNDDVELSVLNINSDILARGGSVTLSTGGVSIPRFANVGLYRLAVLVDPDGYVDESLRGDNTVLLSSSQLTVVPNATTVSLVDALDVTFVDESNQSLLLSPLSSFIDSNGKVIPAPSYTFTESGDARWFGESHGGSIGGDRALVPPLATGQTASFSIVTDGPIRVSFNWSLSSQSDILSFTVDGVTPTPTTIPATIIGQQSLRTFEAVIGSTNPVYLSGDSSDPNNVLRPLRTLTWTYRRIGANPTESVTAVIDNITVTPLSKPDLAVTQLSYNSAKRASYVLQDNTTPLDVVVLGGNFGKTMTTGLNGANSFDVEIRLSKDKVWGNSDDVILGKLEPVQSLDASNRFIYSQLFDLQNCIPEGAYYIATRVDSASAFSEIDETNNLVFSSNPDIVIEARPNLQIESRKVKYQPGLYTRRQLLPVEFTIVNVGCKDIAPGELVNYAVSMYGSSFSIDASSTLTQTILTDLDRSLVAAQDSSGLRAGSSIKFYQQYRIPNYMERIVVENFSGFKPLKDELFNQFVDFDITSENSSGLACNAFLSGFDYIVPYSGLYGGYPRASLTPLDLPNFTGGRGPILFGLKVSLSSNVPLVASETIAARPSLGVIRTRPESSSYNYFRRFWSLKWNQLPPEGEPASISSPSLYPDTIDITDSAEPVGTPFGFDVGDRDQDSDGDGFTNGQEYAFGSNPWIRNPNTGQALTSGGVLPASVTTGIIELNGLVDTSGQVIHPPTKFMSTTFNVLMQHSYGVLSSTSAADPSFLTGLIGKAPVGAYATNDYLTYVVEVTSTPAVSPWTELLRINPKQTVNQIEGDVLRLLPPNFNSNVVGVTNNGATIRLTITDSTAIGDFSTRFMRVRVINTSP